MKIRKHQGINQKTGKLKKGFKYQGHLKSGLSRIVKVKKGGGILHFDQNVNIVKGDLNDCPKDFRLEMYTIRDDEGVKIKRWKCKENYEEYLTDNGIRCCKDTKMKVIKRESKFGSKLKHPEILKPPKIKINMNKIDFKDFEKTKKLTMEKVKAKAKRKRRPNHMTRKTSPKRSITKAKELRKQILKDIKLNSIIHNKRI